MTRSAGSPWRSRGRPTGESAFLRGAHLGACRGFLGLSQSNRVTDQSLHVFLSGLPEPTREPPRWVYTTIESRGEILFRSRIRRTTPGSWRKRLTAEIAPGWNCWSRVWCCRRRSTPSTQREAAPRVRACRARCLTSFPRRTPIPTRWQRDRVRFVGLRPVLTATITLGATLDLSETSGPEVIDAPAPEL